MLIYECHTKHGLERAALACTHEHLISSYEIVGTAIRVETQEELDCLTRHMNDPNKLTSAEVREIYFDR